MLHFCSRIVKFSNLSCDLFFDLWVIFDSVIHFPYTNELQKFCSIINFLLNYICLENMLGKILFFKIIDAYFMAWNAVISRECFMCI